MTGYGWRVVLVVVFAMIIGCSGSPQPESIKTVAAFEVPLPAEADRARFLAVLSAAAQGEGMHVDAETKEELEGEAQVDPSFKKTMNAAVWRGARDDEAVASAMDQFDHLGQIWLIFAKGKNPALAAKFRERAMQDISLRWPATLALPIMPTGAIPLRRDLLRTPAGYVLKPSEAHRYGMPDAETVAH